MPKIKNYTQSLPVLFFGISLALIAIFYLANFVIYRNTQTAFFSSAQVTVHDSDSNSKLTFSFNLAKADLADFKRVAQTLGWAWSGEPVDLEINQPLAQILKKVNKKVIDLKPTSSSLAFSTDLGTGGSGSSKLWGLAKNLPEDTSFYLETGNLSSGLPKELETFFTSSPRAIAIFPAGTSVVVWLQPVSDPKLLNENITKLEGALGKVATPEAVIQDVVIEKVPVSKITVGDKDYFLGLIDNTQVVTTSEEGFRVLTQVKEKAKNNLLANRFFNDGRHDLEGVGSLALFIGNTDKLNIFGSQDQNLRDLFIFTGVSHDQLTNFFSHVNDIGVVVTGNNTVEGMVNFR